MLNQITSFKKKIAIINSSLFWIYKDKTNDIKR